MDKTHVAQLTSRWKTELILDVFSEEMILKDLSAITGRSEGPLGNKGTSRDSMVKRTCSVLTDPSMIIVKGPSRQRNNENSAIAKRRRQSSVCSSCSQRHKKCDKGTSSSMIETSKFFEVIFQ